MNIRRTAISSVIEIIPERHRDSRGSFSEIFNEREFSNIGVNTHFCQDNQSFSFKRHVLRGLHYQLSPYAQDKLVRVVQGAIFDVAVDLRRGSPDFGSWVSVKLSAAEGNQLFVPKGFAHGYLTLEENTEVVYKVSQYYNVEHERSIKFDDPDIGIMWPGFAEDFVLSEKDRTAPRLCDSDNNFNFGI